MLKNVRIRLELEGFNEGVDSIEKLKKLNKELDDVLTSQAQNAEQSATRQRNAKALTAAQIKQIEAQALDEFERNKKSELAIIEANYKREIELLNKMKLSSKSTDDEVLAHKRDVENKILALSRARQIDIDSVNKRYADSIQQQAERERQIKLLTASQVRQIEAQSLNSFQQNKKNEIALIEANYRRELELLNSKKVSTNATTQDILRYQQEAASKLSALNRQKQIDLDNINRKYPEQKRGLDSVNTSVGNLSNTFTNLAGAMGIAFSVQQVVQFGKEVVNAKGLTDQFRNGMEALLQSKALSNELYREVIELAKASPLGVEEIMKQTLTMKGLGFETAQIIPIMTALGDVAAVVGTERMPFLAKALSDVRNKQVLYAQETKQFSDNGINLYQMLAASMNLPIEKVRELGENHKITYQDIETALFRATEVGGMYYGQQAAQVNTVKGQLEKLKDTYFAAQVTIGDYFGKSILSVIGILDKFLEATIGSEAAIERTVDVIIGAGLVYSSYTAAINLNTIASAGNLAITSAKSLAYKAFGFTVELLTLATGVNTGTTLVNTAAQGANAIAMSAGAVAAQRLNAALLANPFTTVILGVTALIGGFYLLSGVMTELPREISNAELSARELNLEFKTGTNRIAENVGKTKELESEIKKLKTSINSGTLSTQQQNEATQKLNATQYRLIDLKQQTTKTFSQLKAAYPDLLKNIDTEAQLTSELANVQRASNAEMQKKIFLISKETEVNRLKKRQDELMLLAVKQLDMLKERESKIFASVGKDEEKFVNRLQSMRNDAGVAAYFMVSKNLELIQGDILKASTAYEKANENIKKTSALTQAEIDEQRKRGNRSLQEIKKEEIGIFINSEIAKVVASKDSNEEKKRQIYELGERERKMLDEIGKETKKTRKSQKEAFVDTADFIKAQEAISLNNTLENQKTLAIATIKNDLDRLDHEKTTNKNYEAERKALLIKLTNTELEYAEKLKKEKGDIEQEKAKKGKDWEDWLNDYRIGAARTKNEELKEIQGKLNDEYKRITEPLLKGEVDLQSEAGKKAQEKVKVLYAQIQLNKEAIEQLEEQQKLETDNLRISKETLENEEKLRKLSVEVQKIYIETSKIKNQGVADVLGKLLGPVAKQLLDINAANRQYNELLGVQSQLHESQKKAVEDVALAQKVYNTSVSVFGEKSRESLNAVQVLNDAKAREGNINKEVATIDQQVTRSKIANTNLYIAAAQMVLGAIEKMVIATIRLRNEAIQTMTKTFNEYQSKVSGFIKNQIEEDFKSLTDTLTGSVDEQLAQIQRFREGLNSELEKIDGIDKISQQFTNFAKQMELESALQEQIVKGMLSLNPLKQLQARFLILQDVLGKGNNDNISALYNTIDAEKDAIAQIEYKITQVDKLFELEKKVLETALKTAEAQVGDKYKQQLSDIQRSQENIKKVLLDTIPLSEIMGGKIIDLGYLLQRDLEGNLVNAFETIKYGALDLGITVQEVFGQQALESIDLLKLNISTLESEFTTLSNGIRNSFFSELDAIGDKLSEVIKGKVAIEFQGMYDSLSDAQFIANREISQAQSDELDVLRDMLKNGVLTQEQFRNEELNLLLKYRAIQREKDREFEAQKDALRDKEIERERKLQSEIKSVQDEALVQLGLFLEGKENKWSESSAALQALIDKYNLDQEGSFTKSLLSINEKSGDAQEELRLLYEKYYGVDEAGNPTGLIPTAQKAFVNAILQYMADAATAEKALEQQKADELLAIQSEYNDKLASLTRARNEEISRLNEDLYARNLSMALAQLEVDYIQAVSKMKAVNPFANTSSITSLFNQMRGELQRMIASLDGKTREDRANERTGGGTNQGGNNRGNGTRFFNGTESVKGESGIDKVPAMLNVGERVIKTSLNNRVRGVSNEELVSGYLYAKQVANIPNFEYLMSLPSINVASSENQQLVSELKMLQETMKSLKQVNVNVVNGQTSIQEISQQRILTKFGKKLSA